MLICSEIGRVADTTSKGSGTEAETGWTRRVDLRAALQRFQIASKGSKDRASDGTSHHGRETSVSRTIVDAK